MKKEELKKSIKKTVEEQEKIINSTNSISYAAREILGTDSTLARTIIKEICDEQGWNIPVWSNRVRYCLYCGKKIVGGYSKKKFCNNSCAASYNNLGVVRNYKGGKRKHKYCLNCGKELTSHQKSYCCSKCHNEYKNKEYVRLWKLGEKDGMVGASGISDVIRKYIFNKYDNKCQICGWGEVNPHTHLIPLQVHHIDGDCTNNKEENLQLLCPNCHSLTNTYGGSNKNSKRLDRRTKYFKEEVEADKAKDIKDVARCIVCGKKLEGQQHTYCSQKCAKKQITKNISKEQILGIFKSKEKISYGKAAKELGISTTCLRRKCVNFGILGEIQKIRFGS